MTAGKAVACAAAATGEPGAVALGVEGAAAYRNARLGIPLLAFRGKELHHPAHGVGTIETAAWAAHDLGTLEHARIKVVPCCATGGGRAQANAVDHQRCRFITGTTEIDAAGLAEAARSEERRVGKECRSRWWAED